MYVPYENVYTQKSLYDSTTNLPIEYLVWCSRQIVYCLEHMRVNNRASELIKRYLIMSKIEG